MDRAEIECRLDKSITRPGPYIFCYILSGLHFLHLGYFL